MPAAGRTSMSWMARPLARRYVLGVFDAAVVRWTDAGEPRVRRVHWAFGWLPDGGCEPLGVWPAPERDAEDPTRLIADLRARGVERIWALAGVAGPRRQAALAAAFASATDPARIDAVVAEAVGASWWQGPRVPAEVAGRCRNSMARAIRRQGGFESEAAGLDFVAGALQRAQRRLDRAWETATWRLPAEAVRRQVAPAS